MEKRPKKLKKRGKKTHKKGNKMKEKNYIKSGKKQITKS